MSMPKVSIIMPNYNYGNFIEDAILSVLNQSFEDWELIIIDDGSSDNSKDIILRYASIDKRIKYIFNNSNKGIAYSCNIGIYNARGEYILLTASDDKLKHLCLEKCMNIINIQNCGAMILEGELIDENGNKLGTLFSKLHRKPKIKYGSFFIELLKGNFICTGMFRKDIQVKYNISFDHRLKHLNDWLFWLQLSYFVEMYYIDEPLYLYRIHRKSASTDIKGYLEDKEKIFKIIEEKFELTNEERSYFLITHAKYLMSRGEFSQARGYLLRSFMLKPNISSIILAFVSSPIIYDVLKFLKNKVKITDRRVHAS